MSLVVNTAAVAAPGGPNWPRGWTKNLSVPRISNCSFIVTSSPNEREMRTKIVAMDMRIPIRVRKVLSLLFLMFFRAMFRDSIIIFLGPQLDLVWRLGRLGRFRKRRR